MAVSGYGVPVVSPYGSPVSSSTPNFHDTSSALISSLTSGLFPVPGEPAPMNVPSIGLWPSASPANVQQYRENYAANQPPPQPQAGGGGHNVAGPSNPIGPDGSLLPGPADPNQQTYPWANGNQSYLKPPGYVEPGPAAPAPQFDPAASFNNQTPAPPLPGLNTSGTNPYLNDPLMAGYNGMQNPLYANQGQQDFYGDPELFSAPSAASATKG